MDNQKIRNIISGIVCFIISFLLGGLGMSIMILNEVYNSEGKNTDIDKSIILRYVFIGACGYFCNVSLIIIAVNNLWIE